jgi:hypothetical protein
LNSKADGERRHQSPRRTQFAKKMFTTVGRLMELLNRLGQDVEVTVKLVARQRAGDKSVVVQPV